MAPLCVAATMIAMTTVCGNVNVSASSNTVSINISHRSYGNNNNNNYSDGLNIVKSDPREEEEEYVTSFYSRVREKRRAMFGKQLEEQAQQLTSDNLNHSLDHYFDHRISSSSSASHRHANNDNEKAQAPSSSNAARSVRGGGASTRAQVTQLVTQVSATSVSNSASNSASRGGGDAGFKHQIHHNGHHHGSHPRGSRAARSDSNTHPRSDHGSHHSHSHSDHLTSQSNHFNNDRRFDSQDFDAHYDYDEYDDMDEFDGYDKYDDEVPADEEEGDDTPDHNLGLLRVPCSIAINSGEATNHAHAGCSSQAKTPMAAYVDTGAQVTVISASAARRAGIYHLMDRRYAGRATGVGHCKVLGRIPARHVYFLLGEGCDDDDENDDYEDYGNGYKDDDDWSDEDDSDNDWLNDDNYFENDYRGGGGEYYQGDTYHNEPSSSGNMVQMDGPALTVLEGTVTKGVDVLLGLDVLQDWEAEISMSPRRKSITVKKQRRGSGGSSVVIPFVTSVNAAASRSRYPREVRRSQRMQEEEQQRRRTNSHHHYSSSRNTHQAHRHQKSHYAHHKDFDHDFEEEDDFSPTDSDIESDLDLLDQSGHEFHPAERKRTSLLVNTRSIQEMEDELLGVIRTSTRSDTKWDDADDDDDDDYLRDVDDEEDIVMDGEGEIDMSGL